MAHYLVTGGAGFIGSNLVNELIHQGHRVRVLDNFVAGKFERRLNKAVEYVEGDIRDKEIVKKVVSGIDGIFHTAAVPRVPYSVEHPAETNEHNVTGTLNVLVAARDNGVKRVIFSSSQSVYGNNEAGLKLVETMPPTPLSPYALQKYIGELYCRMFNSLYGIQTVSLRYFNVYGPLMDPNGAYALVVGKFLRQRQAGEALTICGDGEYYRDYTNVADVVRANILAMLSDQVGFGEIINIGYGEAHSVNELARLIGGNTVNIPPRPADPRYGEANNELARTLLGWTPEISLEVGLARLKKEWGIE